MRVEEPFVPARLAPPNDRPAIDPAARAVTKSTRETRLTSGRAGDLEVVQPHRATCATTNTRRNGSTTPYSRGG